jgi:hypothetical protein
MLIALQQSVNRVAPSQERQMIRLDDQVAIITGSGRGLGAAHCVARH